MAEAKRRLSASRPLQDLEAALGLAGEGSGGGGRGGGGIDPTLGARGKGDPEKQGVPVAAAMALRPPSRSPARAKGGATTAKEAAEDEARRRAALRALGDEEEEGQGAEEERVALDDIVANIDLRGPGPSSGGGGGKAAKTNKESKAKCAASLAI